MFKLCVTVCMFISYGCCCWCSLGCQYLCNSLTTCSCSIELCLVSESKTYTQLCELWEKCPFIAILTNSECKEESVRERLHLLYHHWSCVFFYKPVLFINMFLYRIGFYIRLLSNVLSNRFIQPSGYAGIFFPLKLSSSFEQNHFSGLLLYTPRGTEKSLCVCVFEVFEASCFCQSFIPCKYCNLQPLTSFDTFTYNGCSPFALFSNQKAGSASNVTSH